MKMWICRDMDGTLWLSEGEPYLDEEKGEWNFRNGNYMNLSKEKYPEVTFENSPMEVELVIKSQNKVTECYNCHEAIKFTENDVIDGWYVKCPCCGEEISILL